MTTRHAPEPTPDAQPVAAADVQAVFDAFYRTARAGHLDGLSDDGGPFGFDITVALQIDQAVTAYRCDGIVETGTHLGDTAEYLARRYPNLPVRTCELDPARARFAEQRLRAFPNTHVVCGDSAALLPVLVRGLARPMVVLDAHWAPVWPLPAELAGLAGPLLPPAGCVVAVDDFAIGHPRFGHDTYEGVVCGLGLVAETLPHLYRMFVGNPTALYPLPCLQPGRRSGTGYLALGVGDEPLLNSPWFTPVPLRPAPVLPTWSATPAGATTGPVPR